MKKRLYIYIIFPIFYFLLLLLPAEGNSSKDQISTSFPKKQAAVFYFYWYDIFSGLHFFDHNGKDSHTDHPPPDLVDNYSYRDVSWHTSELIAMMDAKIDIVLPVYWGNDGCLFWSQTGLKKLVRAVEGLSREGYNPPRIGMFFDTTSLQSQKRGKLPDLTKTRGRKLFYRMISDFYTLIPKKMWARIDNRPLIYLYSAAFVSNYNQNCFDFVYRNFREDFGVKPFIVKEISWKNITADGVYSWGASLYGPTVYGRIGNLGPGYDDSACRRSQTRIKDREFGDFYAAGWEKMIGTGVSLVTIETWNEWHEGSEIANSKEFGKKYLQMTAEYIDLWKQTDYNTAPCVWFKQGIIQHVSGLWPIDTIENRSWKAKTIENRESFYMADRSKTTSHGLYLDINDFFLHAESNTVWITVEYLDRGNNSWFFVYDSAANSPKNSPSILLRNTRKWRLSTLKLSDSYFGGRLDYGADLILKMKHSKDPVYFGRIWLSKHPPENQAPNLRRIKDQSLKAGRTIEVPVKFSDPKNDTIALNLLRKIPFVEIIKKADGYFVLKISPSQKDIRSRPYLIYLQGQDKRKPPLSDITTFNLSVKN